MTLQQRADPDIKPPESIYCVISYSLLFNEVLVLYLLYSMNKLYYMLVIKKKFHSAHIDTAVFAQTDSSSESVLV